MINIIFFILFRPILHSTIYIYFPSIRQHEEFGYCQAGTSSFLLQDGTLILGSPGPYTWRGTIFIIDTNEDFLKRDQHVYLAPYSQSTSPVEKYSYLGQ